MDKNEFDIDFDFEKEFGLTPEDLMDPELDNDLDLSQFDLEDSVEEDAVENEADDIDSFLNGTFDEDEDFSDDLYPEEEPMEEESEAESEENDGDVNMDDTMVFFEDRKQAAAIFAEAAAEEELVVPIVWHMHSCYIGETNF